MTNLTLFTLVYELGIARSLPLFGLAFFISMLISFVYSRKLERSLVFSFLSLLLVFLSYIFIPNLPIYLMLVSTVGYFVLGILTGIISILLSMIYNRTKRKD